ncbi:SH2 domain-containing protein 6 isoform X6 [Pelodiscus sinensis]|uniref:SH2 domain-containing protein 6 isoform X6 n=1 Tax=Pelodiscus sinensis TaxID=13735 RepID=UPI003F6AA29F
MRVCAPGPFASKQLLSCRDQHEHLWEEPQPASDPAPAPQAAGDLGVCAHGSTHLLPSPPHRAPAQGRSQTRGTRTRCRPVRARPGKWHRPRDRRTRTAPTLITLLPAAAQSPTPSCPLSSCQRSAWGQAQMLAMGRRCPGARPGGKLWTEAGHSSPRRPAVAGAPCPAPAGRPRRSQLAPLHPRDRSLGEEVYLACELPSPPPCRAALAPRRLLSQVPPLRPPKIPKPKIILPGPEQKLADASPRAWSKGLACPGGGGAPQEDPDQAWYAGSCDRQTAESVLQGVNKDGAFMVRQSSGQGWSQPFTLAVLHRGHVYNIPIRYLASSCQYTLGKDRKGHEQRFASVAAMVQHYQEHPLVLIDGSSASRAPARLLFPAKP